MKRTENTKKTLIKLNLEGFRFMGRAQRRFYYYLQKAKVRRFLKNEGEYRSPREIGILVNHRPRCSCFMCGNPRRKMNEKSVQERKFEIACKIDYGI